MTVFACQVDVPFLWTDTQDIDDLVCTFMIRYQPEISLLMFLDFLTTRAQMK